MSLTYRAGSLREPRCITFVPLTLGLLIFCWPSWNDLCGDGKTVYRDDAFLGRNSSGSILLSVATGLTMGVFSSGLAKSLYSNYVGDIFGAPLAMEALLAFFLEIHFCRPVLFFGWRLNKPTPAVVYFGWWPSSQYFSIMDSECQWYRMRSYRRSFQHRYITDGNERFNDLVFNPVSG